MKSLLLHKKQGRSFFIIFIVALMTLLFTSIIALANDNKVSVLASTLNVRYGPGLSHEILTQVHEDDQLNILGEDNEWYKVRLHNDQIGWVASWLVENQEVSTQNQLVGEITGSEVNVRQFSTTDSDIMGTVFNGEEYQVLYRENEWVQILFQNKVAWIHGDYIEVVEQASSPSPVSAESLNRVRVGMQPTNVRQEPTPDSSVLTTVSEVTEFTVLSETNDWVEIELDNGSQGYVAGWLTEPVDSETEQAPPVEASNTNHYATSLAEATIVIDPGHGGHDPGAVAANDRFVEKEVTLDTALILADLLESAGSNVILTRDTDSSVSLNDRVYSGHQTNADAFISLHYDAVEVANTMSGTTTYYYSNDEQDLAETVNHYLTQYGPLTNNGVRHGDYFVLRENAQPSILLELGYLDNDHDVTVVNTENYQQAIAQALYEALSVYFSP